MQTKILIGLFICHWLADYTHLSTAWMLNAKKFGTPLLPIIAHATIHAVLMMLFLGLFILDRNQGYLLLSLTGLQLVSHFLIDLWKDKMNYWFTSLQNPANKWYWIVFGFDQLLHALVIIGMSQYVIS